MTKHIIEEAKRCLQCKNPLCRQECPISTDVPSFIKLFLEGNIQEAGNLLFNNNPLSTVCSIVCPHEEYCQGSCILGRKGKPISVGIVENYISDYYLNLRKDFRIEKRVGNVAIIGSGPSGLAAAFILAERGFNITLFEAQHKIGGFLRYGIPEFRLPNKILDTYHSRLKAMGVKIRPNTLIGPGITIDTLFSDGYDAVFIATGVWEPNNLHIKGESLGHVHYALSYLKTPDVYDLGNRVVVIGGGNTAMDVARTAIRKGSNQVTVLYRRDEAHMPASELEVEMAKLDGVKFEFFVSPVEILENGIKCIKTQLGEDGSIFGIEGSEFVLEVDSVIISVSQGPKSNIIKNTTGIEASEKGFLIVNEKGMTTREGVFAAGDVVTGARTVVEAVHQAKASCDEIEEFIHQKYNKQ